MADDYEEPRYSAFWPIVIVLSAFLFSSLVQLYGVISQRSQIKKAYVADVQLLPKAQAAQTRLISLMNDLMVTSSKDPLAGEVIREVKAAGIIHDTGATNGAAAAPAPGQ